MPSLSSDASSAVRVRIVTLGPPTATAMGRVPSRSGSKAAMMPTLARAGLAMWHSRSCVSGWRRA